MLRFLKKFACVSLVLGTVQSTFAFSMLGPFDFWQVTQLSLNLPGDLGGPMNLGEEYRYNIPVLYYSFDQPFLDYFGAEGVKAIDNAMAILNGLSSVSSYSSNLAEVPLEATR